jgi:ribosomal protein S18 acetylase RimI-like enzyme
LTGRHPPALELRAAGADDEPFLYRVYGSTREDELAPLGWDEAATEAFLRMQFAVQSRAYRDAHPQASFEVIVVDGEPAGRLYVDRAGAAIHVVDIALLPTHRGAGIGTRLLADLIDEARRAGRRVEVEALRGSRAVALYERLGFRVEREGDVYIGLGWSPRPPRLS